MRSAAGVTTIAIVSVLVACAGGSASPPTSAQPPASSAAPVPTLSVAAPSASASAVDAGAAPSASTSGSASPPPKCLASFAEAQKAGTCGHAPLQAPCAYTEGTCECVAPCEGGTQPMPGTEPPRPLVWECTYKGCATAAAGKACTPAGAHCGRCYGDMLDCKRGTWVKSTLAPPP
jgi:hypothetical protein